MHVAKCDKLLASIKRKHHLLTNWNVLNNRAAQIGYVTINKPISNIEDLMWLQLIDVNDVLTCANTTIWSEFNDFQMFNNFYVTWSNCGREAVTLLLTSKLLNLIDYESKAMDRSPR